MGPQQSIHIHKRMALNRCEVSFFSPNKPSSPLAKAPANQLKHFARAAIDECRDHLTSQVLMRAANTTCIKNAERDLLTLFKNNNMVAPIRPSTVTFGNGSHKVDIPCIRLRTWWDYLLSLRPTYVLGGFRIGSMSQLLLETYWGNLQQSMPNHAIYTMFEKSDWGRCIPFYLHMDEGVGQRKRAVLVVSAQTPFGIETAQRYFEAYKTAGVRSMDDASNCMSGAQFHSSKGSTYKSRFLFTAIPKKNYSKKFEPVYHGMLQLLAEECCSLMQSGVTINGTTYYPICMGLKGDAPALAKAGYFCRYFATMGKNKGCCHECLAGLDGFEFENVSPTASWTRTIGLEVPWKPQHVSPSSRIPGDAYIPERFYKKDPFHVFKQSLGGYFISSCIVVLGCDLGLFAGHQRSTAVASILEDAYMDFEYYVKHEWRGKSINHIKAFTKEILHYPRVDSYPAARFKGSDCMLLLRWLRHLMLNGPVDENLLLRPGVNLTESTNDLISAEIYKEVLKGSLSAVQFFHILHTQGLWLTAPVAKEVAVACQDFCSAYAALAKVCFQQSWVRFRLEPCLHHFHHFAIEIQLLLSKSVRMIYSPASHLCEADEDFVGRICRGSRMVHAQSMTQRTLDRYLVKLWFEHKW